MSAVLPPTACAVPTPAPLHSAMWFRVAGLRPRLDPHARIHRSVVRRQVWHTLQRADGSLSFRLDVAAWSAVARCDGERTVQTVWAQAQAAQAEHAPTQDELLDLLARLHTAGLMSFDHPPDFGAAAADASAPAAPAADPAAPRNSLLAWRWPLGHPDALLARWAPRVAWAFTPAAAALWLVAMLLAAVTAALHGAELAALLRSSLGAPRTLAWAWLVYPVIKALHELAHGLATRHAGAPVPSWGISLLMGVPVPYVDASAASTLPARRQRLAVAGAGIVVELTLAALALGVLLSVQAGVLRDLAALVFFIGALSSLAVNANPLLRFDGYHLLCDAADLPNLATRSNRHVWQQLRSRCLGVATEASVQPAPGEARWLWVYAPAALLMRWVVAVSLVGWLGGLSWLLGGLAALVSVWTLLGQPALHLWRWQRTAAGWPASQRASVRRRLLLVLAGVGLPVLLLPLPDATVVPGVLGLPEHALVRAQSDGVVAQVLVADGDMVQAGDALLQLHSPALQAEIERLTSRVEALQSSWLQALGSDAAAAVAAEHGLHSAQAELADAQTRREHLTVRPQAGGRVVLPQAADAPGRYVARGQLLAHVITGEPGVVRVAIPQQRVAGLAAAGRVSVMGADAGVAAQGGQWSGASSGGGALLPSAALGERSGGAIATDPDDPQGLRPAQPVVLGEVQLDGHTPLARIGQRVWVRFETGHAPLLWQALRAVQQQVLAHFNPAQ